MAPKDEVVPGCGLEAVVEMNESHEEGLGVVVGEGNVVMRDAEGAAQRPSHDVALVPLRRPIEPSIGRIRHQCGRLRIHLR